MFETHVCEKVLFQLETLLTYLTCPRSLIEVNTLDVRLQVTFKFELFLADFALELAKVIVHFHVSV